MLKSFLAKHFGLVELNELEKHLLFKYYKYSQQLDFGRDEEFCSRLTALGIPFTYNKRTGIK